MINAFIAETSDGNEDYKIFYRGNGVLIREYADREEEASDLDWETYDMLMYGTDCAD